VDDVRSGSAARSWAHAFERTTISWCPSTWARQPARGDVGWKGGELIAVRLHLPSRIRYHNAGAGNLRRGNILVWEQPLTDRQAGKPLEIEARIEQTSILYSTLVLFAVSGLLALLVLAAVIWWVVRKGKRAA
jgi:hypothetical protein